jgi:predicted SnoaL-like aldol condensation-catalyzing enzyme
VSAAATPPDAALERNKQLIASHFDDFVNRRDLTAIDRNVTDDFVDHDGPGGRVMGRAADRAMMAGMHALFADLRVDIRASVAEGDMVVVRNVWTGTNAKTGERMECHGFVQWRIEHGKIAERWATVTPMHDVASQSLDWGSLV